MVMRVVDQCRRIRLPANPPHQPAQMAADFAARRRLAGAQQNRHAVAAVRIIHVDRQKTAFVIVRVEQRQLLLAVHHIEGVVDVQRHRLRRTAVTPAPQIHHGVAQPQQGAQVGRVFEPRDGRLRR
jgi:hypothetical protein